MARGAVLVEREGVRIGLFVVAAVMGGAGLLLALRSARERVAADKNMPADVKADVLKQLDGEIEKAAKAR